MLTDPAQLTTIAANLGRLYTDRVALGIAISQLERDAEARRVQLAPPDGWPGKNAEARDLAERLAYAQDAALETLSHELLTKRNNLAVIEGQIAAMEAERRALEWQVRARMIDALATQHTAPPRGDALIEAAFDTRTDQQLFEAPF
jgi:hypothetical protein